MILVTSLSFTDDFSNWHILFYTPVSIMIPGNFNNDLNGPSDALTSHFLDLIPIDQVLHPTHLLNSMSQSMALSLESQFQ